ncbi:CHASE domain-containing protein [Ascidiaceihabitans sp.]|uniref:sensor histidine kinase n=2 Tax=Ascidiaceihabitans sp. TaxID=1872644 RepID=UPI00329A0A47
MKIPNIIRFFQNLWMHPRRIGRISAPHIALIVMSLTLTLSVWQFSKAQIASRTQARFDTSVSRLVDLIEDRMSLHEDALWAGVSTIESHGGDISRDRWQAFTKTLRLEEKYPGITGIGVIHFLNANSVGDYLKTRRLERAAFDIFPRHDHRDIMPISFIEPEAENTAALGLDLAHEANRRTAAIASRDTGTAQISGPIVLVQDKAQTPGFLFYAPVYHATEANDGDARPLDAVGAVYAPFVVHKLIEGLLAKERRHVHFSISDQDVTLYDEHLNTDAANDPDPMFATQVALHMYGREWLLDMRSNAAFRLQNSYAQPTIILLAGLTIEGLIIVLLIMMSRANAYSERYADKVTAQLKLQTQDLKNTNQELEQFAYVASHDLKTPIRGIAGLTEMIREDLEGYFASPSNNPEVGHNLDRIMDRVARMNALTQGIMELSKTGTDAADQPKLELQEAVDALVLDFELDQTAIKLNTRVSSIAFDPFNLRRILENLIGNAIKYHDGKRPLLITLEAAQADDRCRISIHDNGPGIDPRYHTRIFNMFQTLRLNGAAESTGIGLAIVKKAVERHGGRITVISPPEGGVLFAFDWPLFGSPSPTHLQKKAA